MENEVQLINDKKNILLLELDSTVHCSDIFQRNDIFSGQVSCENTTLRSISRSKEEKRKKKEGQYKGA